MFTTEKMYALYLECFSDYAAGFDTFVNRTGLDDGKTAVIEEADKGFALIRDNALMLLCVKENTRGQGIGSRLLETAEKEIFMNHDKIVLGNTPSHYLYPGAPVASKPFFEKRGYSLTWECYDMMIDLEDDSWQKAPDYEGDDFVFGCFAALHNMDNLKRFGNEINEGWGDIYTGGAKTLIVIERKSGTIAGAVTLDEHCLYDASFPDAGGFGCVGIRKDLRKHGLGMKMCKDAIQKLIARNKKQCFIGYLVLDKWYSKLGAKIIARYAMGEKKR